MDKIFMPTINAMNNEGRTFKGCLYFGLMITPKGPKVIEYIKERNEFPTVIKADGLALGKGVIIPENLDDAIAGVKEIMEDKIFGASGNNIVVEEFLTGPEVSVLAFIHGLQKLM